MSGKHRNARDRAEWGEVARAEVERRVLSAIGRLDVMLQFSTANPACLAQGLHAVHVLRQGWMGNSVEELVGEAPDFQLPDRLAEDLAQGLVAMLQEARLAEWRVRDAE